MPESLGRALLTLGLGFALCVWLALEAKPSKAPHASDSLVRFLTCRESPDVAPPSLVFRSVDPAYLAAAKELLRIGPPALPAVHEGIHWVESSGCQSQGVAWLLLTYAKLERERAFPRLVRLLDSGNGRKQRVAVEAAVAEAFNLTLFRTAVASPPAQQGPVCGVQDAIDRFIIAWAIGDRQALERTLTADSRGLLQELLKATTWQDLRRKYLQPCGRGGSLASAFGYRASGLSGWWEQTSSMLSGRRPPAGPPPGVVDVQLLTVRNSTLGPCSRLRFQTSLAGGQAAELCTAVISNRDFESVFSSLAQCLCDTGRRERFPEQVREGRGGGLTCLASITATDQRHKPIPGVLVRTTSASVRTDVHGVALIPVNRRPAQHVKLDAEGYHPTSQLVECSDSGLVRKTVAMRPVLK